MNLHQKKHEYPHTQLPPPLLAKATYLRVHIITPPPPPRRNRGNYANRIESQLTDSLQVLDLEPGVTRREVNIRYRFLDRQLHPDEHYTEVTGMTSEEAVELFKRVNNAHQFISDSM